VEAAITDGYETRDEVMNSALGPLGMMATSIKVFRSCHEENKNIAFFIQELKYIRKSKGCGNVTA
jgi:hypothetical protein